MSRHLTLVLVYGQLVSFIFAQTEIKIIPNVPDNNQPPDTTLPSTKNDWSNYCAPFAFVNIVEYWEGVYNHPNAQGMMAGMPATQIVEYIGWFMDTNDEGNPARLNGTNPQTYPSAQGTYVIDQSNGMQDFVNFDTSNTLGFPYTVTSAKKTYSWQISPPHPEDFAAAYIAEIGMGRPVKLDFLYWNPIPVASGDSIIIPGDEPEIVYIYEWGPQIDNTDQIDMEDLPWEKWNLEQGDINSSIGHAVTGVGYIIDTLEFAIVHDNWSVTPKNIAIPWRNSQGVPMVTAMILVNLPPAKVTIGLPDTTALTGEQLLIPVKSGDMTGLHVHSFFINIHYDQTILLAQNATSVNSLSATWGSPGVDLSTPGQFIVSHSGISELSGAGDLVYLQFKVTGSIGDSTRLQPKTVAFNFGDPAADTLSGSAKVIPRAVQVTITSNPTGLNVEVDGTSYTTPKIFNWQEGDSHLLSAPASQAGDSGIRYSFDAWSNSDSIQQTIIIPKGDSTFTANFKTEYELAITMNPEAGGTVNLSPNENWIIADSSVIIHAVADSGYIFSEWQGDHSGSKNPDTLVMDQPREITAHFINILSITSDRDKKIPEKFALHQSYPNPFNPSTVIKFDLPKSEYVKIEVFTILGQKLAILVDKVMPAGYHSVVFNGDHIPSGIYIYRMKAGSFTAVNKMILAK